MPKHWDPISLKEVVIERGGGIKPEIASDFGTVFWAASGQPNLATAGTDTTVTASRLYATMIYIPHSCTITGLGFLIGSVGGTHAAVVSMYKEDGTLVANSDPAGTTVGTAANFQALAFTTPYKAVWPARYWVGVNYSGTTPKLRTYPIPWAKFPTALITQTVTAPASFTPTTTYTADYAPFIFTY